MSSGLLKSGRLLLAWASWLLFVSVTFAEENQFIKLFDGETLTGWRGAEGFWRVEDGAIVGESTADRPLPKNTFLIWDRGDVDDFVLKLQFRITGAGSNSGIQFRSTQRPDGHVVGYQADIDRAGQWIGALYDEEARGVLALRGESVAYSLDGEKQMRGAEDADELLKQVRMDDWNEYVITARGPDITLAINGHVTAQLSDHDRKNLDRSGLLALQLHSGPPMKVEFKDIRLQRLPLQEGWKKVVLVAGVPSHGYFAHEHRAGCLLLAEKLNEASREHGLPIVATVYTDGWPKDPSAFDNADAAVWYADGGARHPLNEHLQEFDEVVRQRKLGLVCLHYAVETTIGPPGQKFLEWMGGYFEPHWSVNPHWTASFDQFPEHPITRGVRPFEILDEWYYHMRFVPEMTGVTPILTDLPPNESLSRPDGTHSGNPHVRAAVLERREPQHVAWAYERPNGLGRGFGFTGGHFHRNWQHDDFRKLVLNAIVWAAHGEVPDQGVVTSRPDAETMQANQDEPAPKNFQYEPPSQPPVDRQSSSTQNGAGDVVEPVSDELARALVSELDVHPDLKLELFAAEPLVRNPASIDVDHLGRVWVCEAINYRAFRNADVIGENRPPDRIVILSDTDGDGRADRSQVFYQGADVNSAHGVLVLPTADGQHLKALVSAGDSIFYLIDDDGDLQADRKEMLFTGISGAEHDHGVHAMHFGPDGMLYFNFGNSGEQLKDRAGKVVVDLSGREVTSARRPYQQGMVFRCKLDGTDVETLAWNFRNNWELCLDAYGRIWQSDNDDDGNRGVRINYVMPYGNYGYRDELTGASWQTPRTNWEAEIPHRHWHLNDPGVVPNMLQTGAGAPSGICFYEGASLPEALQQTIIHCDPGVSVCRAYRVAAQGAGYTADIVNLVEGKRQPTFRPSDVCVAPDGSLIIADWSDPGVGGHRMQTPEKGRLYRLSAKASANTAPSTAACDVSTLEGAVAALVSPNMATRYLGWTTLWSRSKESRAAVLTAWPASPPHVKARFMHWLSQQFAMTGYIGEFYNEFMKNPDPEIRAAFVRALRTSVTNQFSDRYKRVLGGAAERRLGMSVQLQWATQSLGSPPDIRVQAECCYLLHVYGRAGEAFPEEWIELAQHYDGADRWYLEALGIAAADQWDAYLSAWLKKVGPDWVDQKATRDIVWRSRSARTPELLAQLIMNAKTPRDELPRYFRAFDFQSPEAAAAPLRRLALGSLAEVESEPDRMTLIREEALARVQLRPDNSEDRHAVEALLQPLAGTLQFVKLVDRFELADRYSDLIALAIQAPQSQLAAEAIRTLYQKGQGDRLLQVLGGDDVEQAEALFASLVTAGEPRSVETVWPLLKDETAPLWRRQAAVRVLASTQPGAKRLLKYAQGEQAATALRPALAAALTAVSWPEIRTAALEAFPPPPGKDQTPVPPIAELLSREGDVARGRIVFNTAGGCNKCHQVNGLGVEVGPNLSEIGKKLARPALYESILYPSAGISHNYETWLVATEAGLTFTGLLASETDQEIVLKDDKGILRTIPIDEIEERRKLDISLMPADMQKLMTIEELVDVVAYLSSLTERKR